MNSDRFVVVMRAGSMMEAEMVKGLLEGEGIAVRIPGELSTDPVVTAEETIGDIHVEVAEGEATRARGVIRTAIAAGRSMSGWLVENPESSPQDGAP